MAGAGGRSLAAAGPERAAGIRGRRATRTHRSAFGRWHWLAALALFPVASAQAQVVASRIWPARDYTRLTLEAKAELKVQVFAVKDPERLVLDLEAELTPALAELDGKVMAEDPYIKGLRVARNRPGIVRLVLDLKTEVKPQLFTLAPVAEYGHRLVLDIYPTVALDPLAELIEQGARRERATQDKVARLATIVIDAGHGGEDPGALARRT